MTKERLLLVGWPGAEWGQVQDLLRDGRLPHLAHLARTGISGPLAPLAPQCHAATWTTVATGVLADRHGVLGPHEVRPDSGGIQDVGQRSWRAPALWQVLETAGYRTACIGWPATAPGARWPGLHADARVAQASGSSFETWAMPPDAVTPAGWRDDVRGLRIHPADGLQAQVEALLPGAAGLDVRLDQRPLLLGAALAEAGTLHAIATHVAPGPWDLLCTCLDLVRQAAGDPELLTRIYALQDMMLGRLVHLVGPGVTIMVVGGGGTADGLLVATGEGIRAGQRLAAALPDVAPTVLARFGLGVAVDGRVISALMRPGIATVLQSALLPALPPVSLSVSLPVSPVTQLPVLDQTDPVPLTPGQSDALRGQAVVTSMNLAAITMARGDLHGAIETLEAVRRIEPAHADALRRLAECRAHLQDGPGCRVLAEAMLALDPHDPWGHLAMAASCVLGSTGERAGLHLDRALECGGADPTILLRVGGLLLLDQNAPAAVVLFRRAIAGDPRSVDAQYGLGVALTTVGDMPAATEALQQAIALRPVQPLAYLQLATVLAAQKEWRASLVAAETAMAQGPGLPGATAAAVAARMGLAHTLTADAARRDRRGGSSLP